MYEGMEGLDLAEDEMEDSTLDDLTLKKTKEVQLKDVYEPAVIAQKMLTKDDEIIRMTDLPERYQIDRKGFPAPDEIQLTQESLFIARQLMKESATHGVHQTLTLDNPLVRAVTQILKFIRVEYLEVPFIAVHRKDYFVPHLSAADLWRVYDLDEKFLTLEMKKKGLRASFEEIQKLSEGAQTDEYANEQIEKASGLDEITDMQLYLQIHYGIEQSMREGSKPSRAFKKPLWRVAYEGALRNNLDKFAKVKII